MNTFGLAPLLLIFPVIGVLFNGLVGRRFVDANRKTGEKWSGWFASIMALSAFAVAVSLFFSLQSHEFHAPEPIVLFDWFNIPSADFRIPWAIQIDTLSVTMMLVVTGVGSLIHIYAIGYMHGDLNFSRFFTYLNLFLFFMLILVIGSSYLMLFVGWEGVGLCSFLLIGFWFDRVDEKGQAMNANAARKAFVANRVGDLAMILAMGLLFWSFGSLEFNDVFTGALEHFEHGEMVHVAGMEMTVAGVLTAVTALFLMGAAGKSAQIPLYVWLPDAMAGPTPVSALIHAATMVTSGIYLLVRSNVLLEIVRVSEATLPLINISSPDLIAYTGAATALFAGLIAFTQFDIKKVLAYSTVSQLGFMIAAVGMGAYVAAMFHLVTHAFFKALLFLGSGSVIHGMEHGHHEASHGHHGHDHFDPQDMRTMGGLRKKMPITYAAYMMGALALAGVFPLAGFWSKDEILAHGNAHNIIVYVVLTIAAFCTAFYMGRQLKMVFFGKPRHTAAEHAHESPPVMTRVLDILAILAVAAGLLNMPFLTNAISEANGEHAGGVFLAMEAWLEHSIQSFELTKEGIVDLPHTPVVLNPWVAGLSTLLGLAALGFATQVVYRDKPKTAEDRDPLQSTPIWFWSRLPLNTLYMSFVVPAFNRFAVWLAETIDWNLWHNFFHEKLIRDAFIGWTRFTSDILDKQGVDGLMVNGSAKLARRFADVIRLSQTGYARNYALSVFLGAVALLAYFLFMN